MKKTYLIRSLLTSMLQTFWAVGVGVMAGALST